MAIEAAEEAERMPRDEDEDRQRIAELDIEGFLRIEMTLPASSA
jgi:hypothetical protein